MHPELNCSNEVKQALQDGEPVVALESTVIAHGLPYPVNVETALTMEQSIRKAGAIPATIAILDGKITVGLSQEQIEWLGQQPSEKIRKCSRRDLPIVVGCKENGATTVAGTMIIAHMAGIKVFATGGIGGVHRGHPFDISADLIELGRTPVAVICSGAKYILDLPLTLEVLETQGVPVIGYQTNSLPAFFTRDSGLPVDTRVDTPEEAAQIIKAGEAIGTSHGILLTVPVPEKDALPQDIAEKAIQQATQEADEQGIHGKDTTPFLLARITELTANRSRSANTSLLQNNAHVAAQIASALQKL